VLAIYGIKEENYVLVTLPNLNHDETVGKFKTIRLIDMSITLQATAIPHTL
jgi:hypothetical protein